MQTPSKCLWVRIGRPILTVVLMLWAIAASPAAGQDTTVSATMLRVLAEAADGFRTGRPVFLVADYRFPHNVAGAFATYEEARRVRRMQADSGATFGVFGPYVTRRDPRSDSASRVVAVQLTIKSPKGRLRTVNVNPDTVDALFFTMPAVDKFVIPYYSRTYGPDYAAALRKWSFVAITICHLSSRNCWIVEDGVHFIPFSDPVRGIIPAPGARLAPP
jgi:hypothetical protein